MGRYLAVHLDFVAGPRIPFRGALGLDAFRIIGLGAVASGSPDEKWFLAGYALEDLFVRYAAKGTRSRSATHLAKTQPEPAHDYLERRLIELGGAPFDPGLPSPFELEEPGLPLSTVPEGELGESVLDEAEEWFSAHPDASAYLYLTADLAIQGRTHRRCFRWLAPDRAGRSSYGTPILFVRLARSHFQEGIVELMVHSSTPVWLCDAGAFQGRVTAEDAETNLRQLAGLLAGLASAGQMTGAELHVQGRLFENEAARLRATIGMQLGTSL